MPDDVRLVETRTHIVAVDGDHVVGTIGVLLQPGRVGLVFPVELDRPVESRHVSDGPVSAGPGPDVGARLVEERLIDAALARLRREKAAFAQLTLAAGHPGLAKPFVAHGFRHVTDALLLERRLPSRENRPVLSGPVLNRPDFGRIEAIRCDPEGDAPRLERLIAAINRDSLDCPELDALRSVQDVLAAHRGASAGGRARWWRYEEDGNDVGIVLATTAEDADAWEILFFGVTPEHRGRGLGRQLLMHQEDVAALESPAIRAGVDARNQFAIKTYNLCGFLKTERVEVWIHPLAGAE